MGREKGFGTLFQRASDCNFVRDTWLAGREFALEPDALLPDLWSKMWVSIEKLLGLYRFSMFKVSSNNSLWIDGRTYWAGKKIADLAAKVALED